MPVFNEKKSVEKIIKKIESINLDLDKELIIIDDGSTDGTRHIVEQYNKRHKVILMDNNLGKGSAVRRGFSIATGDIIIIQDADMEYNPEEYPLLIRPILENDADVVYGSRLMSASPRRVLYFNHYVANRLLTFLSNVFTGLNLSDMESGYKVFTYEVIKKILPNLTSKRFGIEPELTAQVAKQKFRIYEVGISYHGRTYEDGKKINWKDGIASIWHIINFNLFR